MFPFWRVILSVCLGMLLGLGFISRLLFLFPTVPSVPPSWEFLGAPLAIPTSTPALHPENALAIAPRIVFVGDMMFDRNVAKRVQQNKNPNYPFIKLPPKWFATFDYAVANLEGPATDQRRPPEKSIDFLNPTSTIPTLVSQGIDAVSLANNHALDQGTEGYKDSVARLRQAGLLVFGKEIQEDASAVATTTIQGQRFAFVGFNITDHALDLAKAQKILENAKAGADHVIVFMHWGEEYHATPTADQKTLAHWLVDHGADVVIGGHPHWVEGMESYKGKPIVYSLGNFIFDQDFSEETKEGLAVALTFKNNEIDIQPIPVQIDLSQPRILEGEELKTRLTKLANISNPALKEQIEAGLVKF